MAVSGHLRIGGLKMYEKAICARALPQTPLGGLTALSQTP